MVASATTAPFGGGGAHGCAACRQLHADIKVSVTQITDKLDRLFLRVEELFAQKENGTRCMPPASSSAAIAIPQSLSTASRISHSFSKGSAKRDAAKSAEVQSINDFNISSENYFSK